MVTTRSGVDAPPPEETSPAPSPTKRVTRASTRTAASNRSTTESPPPTQTRVRKSRNHRAWAHTPSNLTLIWLACSIPLVIWDAGYVLLRPHSMPGGSLHSPIWKLYGLYAEVDYVYGFKALEQRNGWTAAQTWFNVMETLAYLAYLYMVYAHGEQEPIQGRGAPDKSLLGQLRGLSESRTLVGKYAARAVLLGFSTASLTFFKTVLYWAIELLSGFDNIGHNDWSTLIFMWIVPNGAWLIFPSYIMYVLGAEILQGLDIAGGENGRKKQ